MKELEPNAQDKELAVHGQHKTFKIIGQMQVVKGLTLWEFDPETKKLAPAQYVTSYDIKRKEHVKSVVAKKDHVYVQALNFKNAARKIDREMKAI